ncbi:2-amino-4-hydroxy-6-hydroxymethyldihydropteridine diphosphokinase [Carboxylicivirga sp. A043]|uniref:2-amino-4-hydroxy-6- hydroxymethyldihydropteridine diphosphokinase n=1 Tax=Carboxylicivirga litoralis TaxID=2816963 RepID=UPI0021CB5FBA|nr:2-amino-4-hydroxy-6-hydroxymethyldihydropteridine diphosphokinase [Carboxylicivirga sp. A043]MCU4156565.1 2-amino-4-hydroxy-6-hydroxymethyldihydropteridine diphosphokinase [Carboxylicivirga sp. A043]
MNKQILLLGGNQDDVISSLKKSIVLLSERLKEPILVSDYYESEAWGFEAEQNFINQVVEFNSDLDPIELLDFTQKIEKKLGRKTKTGTHYESRPIDIDILFFNDEQITLPRLIIPHPKLHERRFTLLPLLDHWATLMHPVFKKTITQLTENCTDAGMVRKIED